jgi:vacuolar-type H+-ATPase subunit E/Vma4
MHRGEELAKRDLLLCDVIEKYSEWLEMSTEPEYMLIEILTSLLQKSQEQNNYLKTIAYSQK